MFLSVERLDQPEVAAIWTGHPVQRPVVPATARSEHAKMLNIAAARRLRAYERASVNRPDDAEYWKAVAPAAIQRAAQARLGEGFRRLP